MNSAMHLNAGWRDIGCGGRGRPEVIGRDGENFNLRTGQSCKALLFE
jgi:hypothetical protein